MRRRQSKSRPAAAAVEFAILLPFLMYICVVTVDWARLFYYTISAETCARNGALYACDPITQSYSPYASVTEAALAEAPVMGGTPTVTSAFNTDADNYRSVTVTVSLPFTTITNFPGVPKSQTVVRQVRMREQPLVTL